ncbi:MAG: hypothetical protein ACOC3V_04045, partial [bacterium]
KRVMSATNKARRDLKEKLAREAWDNLPEEEKEKLIWNCFTWKEEKGKELYKNLSKEEKRNLIVNEFMVIQAKELLTQVAFGKHYLTEEEIERIVNLGLENELDKAQERKKSIQIRENKIKLRDSIQKYFSDLESTWSDVDENVINQFKSQWENYSNEWDVNYIDNELEKYNNKLEYSWLLKYSGDNKIVQDIQYFFKRTNRISEKQSKLAQDIINNESREDNELENVLGFLLEKEPENKFYNSIQSFYNSRGYVSSKQRKAIMKSYKKMNT